VVRPTVRLDLCDDLPGLRAGCEVNGPLVSVVVPTYNRAQLLARTLASLAGQSHRPLEAIVVDDGSQDGTSAVVELARLDFQRAGVTLHFQALDRRFGPARARNVGLRTSAGSFVAFLDSDDLWEPQFVSRLVRLLECNPTCAAGFSGNLFVDLDDRVVGSFEPALGDEADGRLRAPFEVFMRRFPFCTPAVLTRTSALELVGFFDETLKQWEDADLWLRLAKQFDFAYTSAPLLRKRNHDGSISVAGRLDWHESEIRVLLRHLDDVRDPLTRRLALAQIQRAQLKLQEELLSEGRSSADLQALLYNECSPRSARFRLGHLAIRAPASFGQRYPAAIQQSGAARRWLLARSRTRILAKALSGPAITDRRRT
jgi:glycosyltransferase involved in cell wall biosynthesis